MECEHFKIVIPLLPRLPSRPQRSSSVWYSQVVKPQAEGALWAKCTTTAFCVADDANPLGLREP